MTDLRLADPEGRVDVGGALRAGRSRSPTSPNRVIAVWPPEQTVDGGRAARSTSRASGLRASASAGLSPDLPFRGATVESGPATLDRRRAGASASDRVVAAARRAAGGRAPTTSTSTPRGAALEGLGAGLDLVRLDAQVTLDAPARPAPRRARRCPAALRLASARLSRGDLALTGDGRPRDRRGRASSAGELTVVAENWRGMLDLAGAVGLLDEGRRGLFEGALGGLARRRGPDRGPGDLRRRAGQRARPAAARRAAPARPPAPLAAVGPRPRAVSKWKWLRWKAFASGPSTVVKGPQAASCICAQPVAGPVAAAP